MKIGVDAVTVGESLLPAASGMRMYTTSLLREMAAIDRMNEFLVFESSFIDLHELDVLPNIRRIKCGMAPKRRRARVVYQNTVYSALLRSAGLDVFLASANVLPLGIGVPSVVVVQGLQWFTQPESFGRIRGPYLRFAAKNAARRAKHLVAVSEAARLDAIRYLGPPPNKVEVIPHGISPSIQDWARSPEPRSHHVEPYILNVATFYHHKNLLRLIDAFAEMRTRWHLNYRLRLIGGNADLSETDLRRHAQRAGVAAFVDLLGPINHTELAAHYAGANLFVYPSLYETFGLPPLEAMVLGCPVVAANSSSIPEIVGDAALLVEPTDVTSLAEAMGSVLTNTTLSESLVAKGKQRAREFSWARTAKSYLELLHRTSRGE